MAALESGTADRLDGAGSFSATSPYLEVGSLRRLMFLTWTAVILMGAAGLPPEDLTLPPVVADRVRLWGLALATGLVLFLLYRSSERLKAASREFRRLFQLSSDLAETTEPAVLGELIARYLAAATGYDDCVIYALAPETNRLVPFGSHPVERSLETDPESIAGRPLLGRVIHDRARIVIDEADVQADPAERRRRACHRHRRRPVGPRRSVRQGRILDRCGHPPHGRLDRR